LDLNRHTQKSQRELETRVAWAIIAGDAGEGGPLQVEMVAGKLEIVIKQGPGGDS